MSSYPRGGIAELRCTFLDRPNGVPTDPTAISLKITDGGGATVAGPWTYPTQIVRELIGLYGYDWAIPEGFTLGDYTAVWQATISAVVRTGYELFTVTEGAAVIPGQPASWATTEDVQRITGVVVSSATVDQAQAVIDIQAGRTFLAKERTGTRDQNWLKYAVAYQAAWLLSQPDFAQRMDLLEVSGPGASSTRLGITPTAMVLAPMAKWALRRVSWLKSRSLHTRGAFTDGAGPVSTNPLSEANDAFEDWAPIAGGR